MKVINPCSKLVSNCYPSIVQVVSPSEYLEVAPIWYHGFGDIVDLFGLLTLASSLTEYDICFNVADCLLADVSFDSDKACLLGMLQVVSVALGYLPVDCLLDPCDLVDQFVSVMLHHLQGEPVLGVDYPDEQEAVGLKLVEGD